MKFRTFKTFTRNRVVSVLAIKGEPKRLGRIIMKGTKAVYIPEADKQWDHDELAQLARAAQSHADFYNDQRRRRDG